MRAFVTRIHTLQTFDMAKQPKNGEDFGGKWENGEDFGVFCNFCKHLSIKQVQNTSKACVI